MRIHGKALEIIKDTQNTLKKKKKYSSKITKQSVYDHHAIFITYLKSHIRNILRLGFN